MFEGGKRWNYGAQEHDGPSTSFAHPVCTRHACQLIWVKGVGKGRERWNYGLQEHDPRTFHAIEHAYQLVCVEGVWRGRKRGIMVREKNGGRFPCFSSTLHVLTRARQLVCVEGVWRGRERGIMAREKMMVASPLPRAPFMYSRACQLVCVEGIWRGSERGIIARKNRMGGPPPLRPLYVFACLGLVSLSMPLNACRARYRSAFSRVAIFTRLLAQLAHSDIPEKVRYYSQPMFRDFMLFLVI